MEDRERLVRALATAGVVAPAEEADALLDAAGAGSVDELVARRLDGEPLAWIVGWTPFLGLRITVDRGVFVPRPHTELLARRAVDLLPADGVAVDLCTGCGAIAAGVDAARPDARVLATDDDPIAVACARRNGVDAMLGDLDEPLPHDLRGRVDVLSAVVPYVPTEELHLLPRDVVASEPRRALDGGPGGTTHLLRVAERSPRWLRPGGSLLLELGGDQAAVVGDALTDLGFRAPRVLQDEDGDDRGIEARFEPP